MGFAFLPHTADVKVRAEGASFVDACDHALQALTHHLTEQHVHTKLQYSIEIQARTKETLLVDLLSEAIYLFEAKSFLIHSAQLHLSETDGGWKISGVLHGDDASGYETSGGIKAATYHDLRILEQPGRVALEFVLDV